MSLSNEEYIQKIVSDDVSHSNCDCPICLKESARSFFSGASLINTQALINNLYGEEMEQFQLLPRIADIMRMINAKTTNHFGDMEFALNEYGEPDGLKNEQEIVLTVASEVSEEVAEEVFNNIKSLLFKNDHINELAMQLLKESKEK
jgi:hypothetical protein